MSDLKNSLNPEQIKPVMDTEGAVLVIAGAGSGKTRVLTSRIAHIIEENLCSPSEILAITFTNKAANEMRSRIEKMVGDTEDIWVSTIHSMCTRILRANIGALGFDKNFTIYADSERERVVKRIIAEQNGEDKDVKQLKFHISNAKMLGLSPRRYLDEKANQVKNLGNICENYMKYEEELKKSNALDFDDLLLKTRDLLLSSDDIREYYAGRFRYLHVDEFQDVNSIQYELIKLLCSVHGNIFAVGDDDQSIYGWRGAEIKNILNFERDFKGAKVYKLEQNYRSTKKILDLANKVIVHNTERKQKELWTENDEGGKLEVYNASNETDEAGYVAMQIKKLVSGGVHERDIAVLMRINALSRAFEQEFLKYNIPYRVYGGFKFFERKEIKDILAYFRILNNPLDNDAILRIINVPRRGIGDKTIEIITEYAEKNDMCLYDALLDVENIGFTTLVKSKLVSFKNMIVKLVIAKETKDLSLLMKDLLDETNFMSQFEDQTEENLNKRANIDELQNSVLEFCKLNEEHSLSDYLSSVTLSSDTDNMDENEAVSIATVHSVKGLEFDTVFIVGAEENVFPISRANDNPEEMEEERRLMYVAITRAKKHLHITYCSTRYLYGTRQNVMRSRFLEEVADELGLEKRRRVRDYDSDDYSYSYGEGRAASTSVPFGSATEKDYSSSHVGQLFNRKVEQKNSEFDGYSVGKRVNHVKFGDGIIIKAKGSGKNLIVDVAFKGIGVKSLAVAFAPMKLL